MEHAYTEPACSQLLGVGVISYPVFTDKFGQASPSTADLLAAQHVVERDVRTDRWGPIGQAQGNPYRFRECLQSEKVLAARWVGGGT